ncbi:hypothetical protein [Lactobacillus sp. Sy-1]|uniref:hypothetical protein n=1 Tax=Lactobacillus sp. Sy-1 TaxID=2109645 RepID=UPI001C59224B|nr:hypothetical protein [Lactobacillus sp. Sy-1]MBW1605199.1 hypothetical protein [Lactobacillus sp. Sy-1]
MKKLTKLICPFIAVILLGSASAKSTSIKGAPQVLKGTWVTKAVKAEPIVEDAIYQKNILFVTNRSIDEAGLFYKTKTKPAKPFNSAGGAINSGLKYTKHGKTYYLSTREGKIRYHYKVKMINQKQMKVYFGNSYTKKQPKKWESSGKYYKQSTKIVTFTTKYQFKY